MCWHRSCRWRSASAARPASSPAPPSAAPSASSAQLDGPWPLAPSVLPVVAPPAGLPWPLAPAPRRSRLLTQDWPPSDGLRSCSPSTSARASASATPPFAVGGPSPAPPSAAVGTLLPWPLAPGPSSLAVGKLPPSHSERLAARAAWSSFGRSAQCSRFAWSSSRLAPERPGTASRTYTRHVCTHVCTHACTHPCARTGAPVQGDTGAARRRRTPCMHAMHARHACTPCTHAMHARHACTPMHAMHARTHMHARICTHAYAGTRLAYLLGAPFEPHELHLEPKEDGGQSREQARPNRHRPLPNGPSCAGGRGEGGGQRLCEGCGGERVWRAEQRVAQWL